MIYKSLDRIFNDTIEEVATDNDETLEEKFNCALEDAKSLSLLEPRSLYAHVRYVALGFAMLDRAATATNGG